MGRSGGGRTADDEAIVGEILSQAWCAQRLVYSGLLKYVRTRVTIAGVDNGPRVVREVEFESSTLKPVPRQQQTPIACAFTFTSFHRPREKDPPR